MATGVETAGIVLGICPLLTRALEDYNSRLGTVKAFIRWERGFPKLPDELHSLQAEFDHSLRILRSTIADTKILDVMFQGSLNELWAGRVERVKRIDEGFNVYELRSVASSTGTRSIPDRQGPLASIRDKAWRMQQNLAWRWRMSLGPHRAPGLLGNLKRWKPMRHLQHLKHPEVGESHH
ncbi:hypothetical protein DE146DRAFT_640768 [Phaeosphaeria sp. MPI-PUGE-AT-0046c]|nr:hypothetical protein DE146DRAFT_640768 [Phaeosphaeria sp. MPI-PUGE-AT-0046c]